MARLALFGINQVDDNMNIGNVAIYYLVYPGNERVFLSSDSKDHPSLLMKAANGRALRPLDVTPQPMAVCVHAALQEWRA